MSKSVWVSSPTIRPLFCFDVFCEVLPYLWCATCVWFVHFPRQIQLVCHSTKRVNFQKCLPKSAHVANASLPRLALLAVLSSRISASESYSRYPSRSAVHLACSSTKTLVGTLSRRFLSIASIFSGAGHLTTTVLLLIKQCVSPRPRSAPLSHRYDSSFVQASIATLRMIRLSVSVTRDAGGYLG